MDTRLLQAAQEYEARKSRAAHPDGHTDNGGRWYPSASERQSCCGRVRGPSRAYPWSYMTHCRSAEHVAHLYGVDASELRREHRRQFPAAKPIVERAEAYKLLHANSDGSLCSLYNSDAYTLGTTKVESVGPNHGGGYYAYANAESAMRAAIPTDSDHDTAEHVALVRCEVWGKGLGYLPGLDAEEIAIRDRRIIWSSDERPVQRAKLAFSHLRPVTILAQW